MTSKQLLFGDPAHIAVLRGVTELAKAVKPTLGPKGRNAMMNRQGRPPAITKDGVTVAKEIVLADPYENLGAQLVGEAADKTGDEQIGAAIVRRALEAPLRQIAENAGHSGSVVVGKVPQQGPMIGFDAVTETLVDMFAAGIVDPTKVARSALVHASSVAGLLLTTDVMVTESRVEQMDERESDNQTV
jgi:chaperonin GroEL (HSP60 family)